MDDRTAFQSVAKALLGARRIASLCHANPDADTLGAAAAIALIAERLGKEFEIISPQQPAAIYAFLPHLDEIALEPMATYRTHFADAIADDLAMPRTVAFAHEVAGPSDLDAAQKRALLLDFDRVLGVDLAHPVEADLMPMPPEVAGLLARRAAARAARDYAAVTPPYDAAVIGGGLLGLATARSLLDRQPTLRVAVLEQESEIALHQSGRNSGVIHRGI